LPFDISPSWFDVLKLSGGDGSVSHFRGYAKFSDVLFRDRVSPSKSEGYLFETDKRTTVVARPHFEAQVENKGRVRDETKYPLFELITQIDKLSKKGRSFYSFVSAGEKDANGKGNVDAIVRYAILDGGDRYIDASQNRNLKISNIVTGKGGTIENGGSQINRPKKIIRLDSIHGWEERDKISGAEFVNLWQPTWVDDEQLTDRETRLGGN